MNIDELTIGEARSLAAMFGTPTSLSRAPHPAIGSYAVVRTFSAGVHVGIIVSVDGRTVELRASRRIWSWAGALSCSEISRTGITGGKVSVPVPTVYLTEVIEIIPASKEAEECLRNIK